MKIQKGHLPVELIISIPKGPGWVVPPNPIQTCVCQIFVWGQRLLPPPWLLNKDFQIECPRIDNREVGSRVSSLLNTYDLPPLGAVWVGGRPLGDGTSEGETVTLQPVQLLSTIVLWVQSHEKIGFTLQLGSKTLQVACLFVNDSVLKSWWNIWQKAKMTPGTLGYWTSCFTPRHYFGKIMKSWERH